jgi:four helix bundle protein
MLGTSWLRASQSIPLTIAEGNGKGTNADRRRYVEIARGSALACASILDCLKACEVLAVAQDKQGKTMLIRIVSMLTQLGRREHEIRETSVFDGDDDDDNDNDNDNATSTRGSES